MHHYDQMRQERLEYAAAQREQRETERELEQQRKEDEAMTTNETKHTQGPWTVEENVHAGGIVHLAVVNRTAMDWMPCSITPMHLARAEDYANARLIAAAPEMLEVLETVFEEFDGRYDGAPDAKMQWMGSLMEQARAAIAKARGGAS